MSPVTGLTVESFSSSPDRLTVDVCSLPSFSGLTAPSNLRIRVLLASFTDQVPKFEAIIVDVRRSLDELRESRLQPVVNGTGIVIHTNFGRAPLPAEAMHALNEIGAAYSNLEYDLAKGERGGRGVYIETALALLC